MSLLPRRRLAAVLTLAVATPLLLAACSSTVALSPAPAANTVGCANVIVHLPSSLESQPIRDTNAQSTSAWGSPASILLTCGITTPRVSDQACFPVDGVDWLVQYKGKDAIYTTYGRSPGIQIVVDTKAVPTGSNVLFDLSSAVGTIKADYQCQGVSDTTPTATATPTPTPTPTP